MEPRESEGSKQCDFTRRASLRDVRRQSQFGLRRSMLCSKRMSWLHRSECNSVRCRGSEQSADDFRSWRGVVSGRVAVATIR